VRSNGLVSLGLVNDLCFDVLDNVVKLIADGFTVPVQGIFNFRNTLSFECLGNDNCGLVC
jgi:hypothetical protein